jgi:hypothetical protein
MKYHALSTIKHDGRKYRRGDAIEVSGKQAEDLLEAGAIQEEKVGGAPEPAPDAPAEEAAQPKAGGERAESGEPSLDGQDAPQRAEAEDVSPKISESMTRDELEKIARKEGIGKDDLKAAATKADVVELIEKKRAEEPAPSQAPEVDASADL